MHWKHNLAIMLKVVVALAHRQLLDRRAFAGQPSSQSRHFAVGTNRKDEFRSEFSIWEAGKSLLSRKNKMKRFFESS